MKSDPVFPDATPRRPIGVWMLAVCNFAGAFFAFLHLVPWFLFPPRHAQLPPNPISWVAWGCILAICAGAYGSWAGNKHGRNLLVALLTLFAVLWTSSTVALYLLPKDYPFDPSWKWGRDGRNAAFVAFWIVWPTLNCWIFFGPQARAFYAGQPPQRTGSSARAMVYSVFAVAVIAVGGTLAAYFAFGAPSRPPPILQDQLSEVDETRMKADEESGEFGELRHTDIPTATEEEESRKFTALLLHNFPTGTPEQVLIDTLRGQNFSFPEIPEYECVRNDQPRPEGRSFTSCPYDRDPHKTLQYGWWRFDHLWWRTGCVEGVHVHWTTGDQNRIDTLEGEYMKTCQFLLKPDYWPY